MNKLHELTEKVRKHIAYYDLEFSLKTVDQLILKHMERVNQELDKAIEDHVCGRKGITIDRVKEILGLTPKIDISQIKGAVCRAIQVNDYDNAFELLSTLIKEAKRP